MAAPELAVSNVIDAPGNALESVSFFNSNTKPDTLHLEGVGVGLLGQVPPLGRAFLENLLRLNLLATGCTEEFLHQNVTRLDQLETAEMVGAALVDAHLLTQYQLDRVMAGTTHGLVLAQYRVLDRIGAGGMGVVFLAEHMLMQRKVAIKVLPVDDDCSPTIIRRFYQEMRVQAKLNHPNIVAALDCGKIQAPPGFPALLYLVMEFIDGCDLERYVLRHGAVPIDKACDWIRQAACGLQEAHNHNLIHRDVKPSNILLTQGEKIKLVDFGLVRQFSSTMTDPRSTLGTLDYMPPEQCTDPTSVGTHADIYSLGATLFWLLTGKPPYPPVRSLKEGFKQLQESTPRRLRSLRPEATSALEQLVERLLHRDPLRRPATAMAVAKLLEHVTG